MKRGYFLIAAIVILTICSVFVFAACNDENMEVHELTLAIQDFEYNGEVAKAIIDSGNDAVEVEWFSVSESGELTKIESAPKEPGTYRVRAYIPGTDSEAIVSFTILQASALIENLAVQSKTYDGEPVAQPTYTTNSDSTNISIRYRKLDSDPVGDWTTVAPKEIGRYEVNVVIGSNKNYKEATASANFNIYEAPTFMELDVNPSVEFMVAGDATIVSVSAINQDGCEMRDLLIAAGVKGKKVDVAVEMYMDILKDIGYFEVVTDITLTTQDNGVNQLAAQAINSKLAAYGKTTITVESKTYTQEDIYNKAAECLLDYTQAEIEALDGNTLRNLICKSRTETPNYSSLLAEKLYNIENEIALINAKLDYLITAYSDNQVIVDSLTSAKTSLNTTIDTLVNNFNKYYLSPTSSYAMMTKQIRDLELQIMSSLKAGESEEEIFPLSAQLASVNTNMANCLEDVDEALTALYGALRSQSASINTIIAGLNVDPKELEAEANALFNSNTAIKEKYAKYQNFNVYTGEGAYIEGTNNYFYQCPEMNITYVFNTVDGGHYVYAVDGIVAKENLNKAKILYIAYYFTQSTMLFAEVNYSEMYLFTIDGEEVYLNFPEGEKAFVTQLELSLYDYTILLVTKDGVKTGYLFNAKIAEDKLFTTPYAAICTWEQTDSLVTVTIEGTVLNYAKSEGKLTLLKVEGVTNYVGCIEDTYAKHLIYFNTVNGEKIAYFIGLDKEMVEGMSNLPYSIKTTWSINGDNNIVTTFDGFTYTFSMGADGKAVFVSKVAA